MLEEVKWGEFRIGDLFEVSTVKGIDEGKLELYDKAEKCLIEFIGRTEANYGVKGYVKSLSIKPNEKNVFSISQVGTIIAQLRKNIWYGSQNIFMLKPKNMNMKLLSFGILTALNKMIFSKYENGYSNYPTLKKLKDNIIKLPILENGKINFSFMEKFIAELEGTHLAELEGTHLAELDAYLSVTGLKDYELTEEEIRVLDEFESGNLNWGEFNFTNIFDIKNSGNILSRDIVPNSGLTPYLCASADNNAVSSYISYNQTYLDKGNCVFIGGKTFVVTYQEKDFYSNDSHNLILYLKNKQFQNKLTQLYLATCVNKSISHKYSWGNSISNRKIQKDFIALPIIDNKPIYMKMKLFISAIQKLVIKDVVLWSDEKLSLTKTVINK